MTFVREPRGTTRARLRAELARWRHDRPALRALALREGYLYAETPDDALALATELHLADLFDDDALFLQRGADVVRGMRKREHGHVVYRVADGPREGELLELLFGDRVATELAALAAPLHRDLRGLAEQEGFDRAAVSHATDDALVLDVRVGALAATALATSDGARLDLACLDAAPEVLASIDAERGRSAPRREGLRRLSAAVGAAIDEALRFDRPEGEKTAERDGQLRPVWLSAYLHGQGAFVHESTTYAVFDPRGRPWPPEVCVDLVLDSFERAAGTWFRPRGEAPGRVAGALDFDDLGIANRRGVLAFEKFAADHPALFSALRLPDAERVPFGDRSRFFASLVARGDDFRPGDVVAIQGRKRDGLVHQHAILIERTDPVTGFPYGLADQMKRPRRRTWEGVMAEAPLRSVLYRVRPTDRILAPGPGLRARIDFSLHPRVAYCYTPRPSFRPGFPRPNQAQLASMSRRAGGPPA